MNVLFLCKASISLGLGHLIRSKSLATTFHQRVKNNGLVKLISIGPENILSSLLQDEDYLFEVVSDERRLFEIKESWDYIFFDMIKVDENIFNYLKIKTKKTVTISPIFNKLKDVDFFFHRTKYHNLNKSELPVNSYMGLEYTILQQNCQKINAGRFEEVLENKSFSIGLSMGGGDAANRTLQFIKAFKNFLIPSTIWVMLGEGYNHSFDNLISEAKKNNKHEIILAKTNKSMWQIMQNCSLGIFPGGITSYESAFAGLPSINFFENESQAFLIQELIEKNACFSGGIINAESLNGLIFQIENLFENKSLLMETHIKAKKLIDGKGNDRIYKICEKTFHD